MILDPELDQWSELFRSGEYSHSEIKIRAQKALRAFRRWIFLEVLVTIIMGGGALLWAFQARQTSVTVLAVWVCVSLVVCWLFRLINDWNDWTGLAIATEAFLPVLLRRLRSQLRSADFGGTLFFVQLAVVSTWVFHELNRDGKMTVWAYLMLPSNIVVLATAVAFSVWLAIFRRRLTRQIAELKNLESDSSGELAKTPGSQLGRAMNDVLWNFVRRGIRLFRVSRLF